MTKTKMKKLLDKSLFHLNMDGKIIPHSINPGPQITCPSCQMLRVGKDFTHERYGGEIVQLDRCIYCASKNQ